MVLNKIKTFLVIIIILVLIGAMGSCVSETAQGVEPDSTEQEDAGDDDSLSESSGISGEADENSSGSSRTSGVAESGSSEADDAIGESGVLNESSGAANENSGAVLDASSSAESSQEGQAVESSDATKNAGQSEQQSAFDLSQAPPYSGSPVAVVNNNIPFFTADELTTDVFEKYSDLDSLGRCGVAYANVCKELMPTEPRGKIGMIRPSGWHTVKYNGIVDGNYLYNRCHLIAFELAGENANVKNLITGTRYMNVQGMEPYEDDTKSYVERTGHHVLYRVTPIFEGDNLVASGVLMEAHSVEDNNFYFCVYCYNVQPGININYANGDSEIDENAQVASDTSQTEEAGTDNSDTSAGVIAADGADAAQQTDATEKTYVLNNNTKKFHYPECPSADTIKPKNKEIFTGNRQTLIDQGYDPCKRCNP